MRTIDFEARHTRAALRPASDQPADVLPTIAERLLALSGVAFAPLFLVGFLIGGSNTPDSAAPDQVWAAWAAASDLGSRVGALLALLGAFAFLPFAGRLRDVLAGAEAHVRGSAQLARVAFAGGLIGVTGVTTAVLVIAGATSQGAGGDPAVSKAVASVAVGPFLVGAMGLTAFLAAAGWSTLRSGVFARWTAVVALLGGVSFFVTFFTLIPGPGQDSVFGYGFFPGFLALTTWSIATSISSYRRLANAGAE
jgi:hypothetical protein